MAKRSLMGKKQLGLMGSQALPAAPPARIGGGLPGMMMGKPALPPVSKRAPVMRRKGVALSKFGPGAKVPTKRTRKAKIPLI